MTAWLARTCAASVLLGAAIAATACGDAAGLPYYASADFTPLWHGTSHRVGAFSLLDQTGAAFTHRDLAGRVHVASFIYTRCSVVCPTLVSNLKKVDRAVQSPNFRIVSYSVTPDLDPPAVLAAYGAAHDIDARRWTLATGSKDQIFRLARESYFANDTRMQTILADPNAFLHTEQLLLVDGSGRLRGVYDGTLPAEIDHLIEDAAKLLKERA